MKKILSLMLALALILGVASFSSAEEEPMVITVFGQDIGTGEATLTNEEGYFPSWAALEEKFNVDFQFNVSSSYGDTIGTRLAAGSNLEDIFNIGYNGLRQYVAEGLFKDLTDLIAEYAPNLSAFYEENPSGRSYNCVDGRQYAISESEYYFKDLGDVFTWYIRQDWLDQLNLEMPTTLDELYDTLIAFQNAGIGGGAPVITAGHYSYIVNLFGNYFGLRTMYEDGIDVDENGKVIFGKATEEYKDLLKFLNKLYTSNLIDPLFPNNNDASATEVIANGNAALFPWYANSVNGFLPYYQATDPNATISIMGVLEGPNGVKKQFGCANEWKRWIIPASVSDEKAIRIIQILDYILATEEGRNLVWYGVEGETMRYDEDHIPYIIPEIDDNTLSNMGVRVYGCLPMVYCEMTKYHEWAFDSYNQTLALASDMSEGLFFVKNSPSKEIEDMITKPDMDTYIGEMEIAFIMGKEDIDEKWDEYIAKLYELGLEEKIEGLQMQYDATK